MMKIRSHDWQLDVFIAGVPSKHWAATVGSLSELHAASYGCKRPALLEFALLPRVVTFVVFHEASPKK